MASGVCSLVPAGSYLDLLYFSRLVVNVVVVVVVIVVIVVCRLL